MSDLKINLQEILQDKNTNLKPENLKKGVTCLGVEGTLEGGIDTSDATATAEDISLNKTAYANGQKITGTLPLFPNSRIFTVDGGVTNDAENNRIQIRIINSTKQTLDSNLHMEFNGEYGDVANAVGLTPEKLVKGNTILGVEGTASTGLDTSDATATATDIVKDKTAYVNGEKITGTLEPEGAQITDYFNTAPEDGQTLLKAYPDPIDCSKLTWFNFYNDFANLWVPNLINTENITTLSNLANPTTLGFKQTELDVSSVISFRDVFYSFHNIASVPKLKNLLKNNFYDGASLDMANIYSNCRNLETIPEFEIVGDWSSITMPISANVSQMVEKCPKLSEQSITNILNFLKLLNDYDTIFDTHTLSDIGLSYIQLANLTEDQLAIINSMENWTTGLELYDTEIEIGELYSTIGSKQISLNKTLLEYLTLVESQQNGNVAKWIVDMSVDYSVSDVYEFETKEELISFLNSIKFKSINDTMSIVINLDIELTDGQRHRLTNFYENIITARTKSSINLLMAYVPIQLHIDTKGKDLTNWNIEVSQSDGQGSLIILNTLFGGSYIPISNDVVLFSNLIDYSENYVFNLNLYSPDNLVINTSFQEKGFTEENLTFTFSIGGITVPDISEENTMIYSMMTFYNEDNLDEGAIKQACIYYTCSNSVDVMTDQIKFYSQDVELMCNINQWGTTQTGFSGMCDILDTSYDRTDITAYSYGPKREIDVSL